MRSGTSPRTEGYPSLTARDHWARYAAGIATEALFIALLIVVGAAFALVATVVF